jgi:hypothetical protein
VFDTVSFDVSVDKAEIPADGTPRPSLIVTTQITNNSEQDLPINGDSLAFELFDQKAEPVEELPIANLVVENDSAMTVLPPGEQVEVRSSLKFEPDAVDTEHGFWLKVIGFDTEVCRDFAFVEENESQSNPDHQSV